ncbi:MAG: hypothetical protein CR996_00410 [Draconibacterium sp.]|nr:MAG: hypothetical protein CR996_00410 [Draconibacterium sp.]PIF06490.1 MAG: hypothetical protein CSA36_01585 [Draconibacterium sp.]
MDSPLFNYFFLPLLIFIARIIDVTIGTVRIVMVAKGQKMWAPILGFFEIIVWLLAISRIFENLNNWTCYFGYAAGFATGNYIGLKLEEKLAMGIVKIQIITRKTAKKLIQAMIESGYGLTYHDAKGGQEDVSIIYSIVKRNELPKLVEQIKSYNPNAFYSIEDVRFASYNITPLKPVSRKMRKSK